MHSGAVLIRKSVSEDIELTLVFRSMRVSSDRYGIGKMGWRGEAKLRCIPLTLAYMFCCLGRQCS